MSKWVDLIKSPIPRLEINRWQLLSKIDFSYLFVLNIDKMFRHSSVTCVLVAKGKKSESATFLFLLKKIKKLGCFKRYLPSNIAVRKRVNLSDLIVHDDDFADFSVTREKVSKISFRDAWGKSTQKYLNFNWRWIRFWILHFFKYM